MQSEYFSNVKNNVKNKLAREQYMFPKIGPRVIRVPHHCARI
jgi:hypothetical protein